MHKRKQIQNNKNERKTQQKFDWFLGQKSIDFFSKKRLIFSRLIFSKTKRNLLIVFNFPVSIEKNQSRLIFFNLGAFGEGTGGAWSKSESLQRSLIAPETHWNPSWAKWIASVPTLPWTPPATEPSVLKCQWSSGNSRARTPQRGSPSRP